MNEFLTKDLKISTDSSGAMTVEHKHQGILVDSTYFASRKECRSEAVELLKELKESKGCESYDAQERRLEREDFRQRYGLSA
jgi:hypothetical protein